MDVQDLSTATEWIDRIKDQQAKAERATRRKGQVPRDHPLPQLTVAQFMFQRTANLAVSQSEGFYLVTSQMPPPYPPSFRSIDDLRDIRVSEMALETHHRGRRVVVRVITPPDRMNAVTAIVEDEEETALMLQLYNQPEEEQVPADVIVKPQNVCIIKEPFFKLSGNGSYNLRVDHVSDIVWLAEGDSRIPPTWRTTSPMLAASSNSLRMKGNDAVHQNQWALAELFYTLAVRATKEPAQAHMAYLNRSFANLKLGRPATALEDARELSRQGCPSEKSLYREARALYELRDYSACREKLQSLLASYPANQDARSEINRVDRRLNEQSTGDYNWSDMYKQANVTPPLIDCATYVGPVVVRRSAGRGNGLFTTRPVKAGDLLLCEKAFAYVFVDGDSTSHKGMKVLMNLATKRVSAGGQAQLISQVVQKLYHDGEKARPFMDLHRGGYEPVPPSEVDGSPVVDTFLVDRIVSLNAFGAPRYSRKSLGKPMAEQPKEHQTCGVWLLASRINHACVTNCRRSFIGDMQIVRACQDLEANTELFFHYCNSTPDSTYDDIQNKLRSWNFQCDCKYCQDLKGTPSRIIRERKRIWMEVKRTTNLAHMAKIRRLHRELAQTYSGGISTIHSELPCMYLSLGLALDEVGRRAEALDLVVQSLEARGYQLIARLPAKSTKAKLEISRWGQSDDLVVQALVCIFGIYKDLAPELCGIARSYAETVYSICYGEKETIALSYPAMK